MSSQTYEPAWIAPERPDLVWFSGSDASGFLNDIISQEIGDMGPGQARRSLLLDPTGKLRFLLWVLGDENRIGLATDSGRGPDLASFLSRYLIRVDVDIESESRVVWIVVGSWDGYDVSWPGVERHMVVGNRPSLDEGSETDYDRLRIQTGEPRWGVDVDEATIPHESGLVAISVDFDKGCFLGQELVARIDSRGANTPRNLLILEADVPLHVGSEVTSDGRVVGTLTSTSDGVGLALLKRGVSAGDSVEIAGKPAIVKQPPGKTSR